MAPMKDESLEKYLDRMANEHEKIAIQGKLAGIYFAKSRYNIGKPIAEWLDKLRNEQNRLEERLKELGG